MNNYLNLIESVREEIKENGDVYTYFELKTGYTIVRRPNGVGGWEYLDDTCGIFGTIYDNAIMSEDHVLFCIADAKAQPHSVQRPQPDPFSDGDDDLPF